MLYALINSRSDCESRTDLAWGSLKKIANTVLYLCKNEMENISDIKDLEELKEEYSCSFDDFEALSDCEDPTEEMLKNYYFSMDDLTVEVCTLVEGYDNLVKAFDEYTEDHMSLDQWEMIPEMEETEENIEALADELESIVDDLYDSDGLKFFRERDDEDDDEDFDAEE